MERTPPNRQLLAPRHVDAGEGSAYRVLENVITVKLAAAETGNAFSLSEVCTPSGGGVPLHIEYFGEKTYYVLYGTFVVRIGDGIVVLGAGDLVFVPRNTPSAYRNASPLPAGISSWQHPGGIHERFHAEIGVPVSGAEAEHPESTDVPGFPRMRDRAPSYGIAILEGWRSPNEAPGS